MLIIRQDPRTSPFPSRQGTSDRPLGLAAGENPITVVLMGPAVQLLAEDTDEIVDIDILENTCLRSNISRFPFFSYAAGPQPALQDGFAATEGTLDVARQAMTRAERVLVFSEGIHMAARKTFYIY